MQPQEPGRNDPVALDEFGELARSAGASVVGTLTARVDKPNPRYYVGTGKAEELAERRKALDADLILVNRALSPVQERNLEKLTECRVVDRTGLILDIFAQRARSHEGKLQVELAQLKHMSTRLVRGWTHLERQRGGAIGLRGPGETQLELDRRIIGDKMKALKKRLDKVEVQRNQARRARQRNAVPVVALVGYTNAGKSTLFNVLTGSAVYAADQLFATLDPTVRRLEGLESGPLVLADTVGFIRDLPHDLVAAFRSTLAEARDADLLLHVVDASDPERDDRMADVDRVLHEIGAGDLPQVLVYNKIDLIDPRPHDEIESDAPRAPAGMPPRLDSVDGGKTSRAWVSAVTGAGPRRAQGRDRAAARCRAHSRRSSRSFVVRAPACAPACAGARRRGKRRGRGLAYPDRRAAYADRASVRATRRRRRLVAPALACPLGNPYLQ